MKVNWGAYQHDQDEVGVRITYRAVMDEFGRRMADIHTWNLLGAKHANSVSSLTTKLADLEAAYLNDYRDLQVKLDDGTLTRHNLYNSQMFGGTHVMGFGYIDGPWKMRCEYANMRTFWAIVQGEQRYGDGLYSWRERLSIKGTGGPKWLYMPQMVGAPIAQQIQSQTTFFYVQEGMAVGRSAYIAPPGPLFPTIEQLNQRVITYGTPEDVRWNSATSTLIGQRPTTRWRYVMEATTAQGFTSFILPGTT